MHAPHHVAPEWVEPYRGRFDGGWERWRDETFARQLEHGRRARRHGALGAAVRGSQDWDALGADERRVYARFQEVFAGFLTHTDAQIGRLLAFLDDIGELDNTLVMLVSDNGTSAEGGLTGTFNEHRFTLALPDTTEENLARLDELGGFRSYNHYPWGWAWAGNTPLRLWKRYTWLGGIRTPLIVHWPDGFAARGEVREQFVHAIDLMPTVLDACGVDPPVDASTASRSSRSTARASAPRSTTPTRPTRARCSTSRCSGRARSSTTAGRRPPTTCRQGVVDEERLLEGSRDFATDTWALFRLADDFAEATRRRRRPSRRRSRGSRTCGSSKPGATRCSRSSTVWSVGSPRRCRRRTRPRRAACTGPTGQPGARRLGAAPVRRLPPHRRRRRAATSPKACSARWATGRTGSRSTSATGGWCSR